MSTAPRRIRFADVPLAEVASVARGIDDLYNDALDVIVVRGAMPREPLAAAGDFVDRNDRDLGWVRPNEVMPVEDIQILGTDTPATPTYRAPRGGSLESYLEGTARHRAEAVGVFPPTFQVIDHIERSLERLSGGRPVALPRSADGREYSPLTVRRLTDGKQIGLHHDYHYALALYSELAPRLDTRTLISWVVTLRAPLQGGELLVYAVTPETPDAPKLADGHRWDLEAVERRFDCATFTMGEGDLFVLASGRCLHRVNRVAGSRARVTLGGFLALEKNGQRVLYWS